MAVSVFDLFSIGIGPSSSHTVGPMRAAHMFAKRLEREGLLPAVARVRAELFGSLGAEHGETYAIGFDRDRDLVLHRRKALPYHPNGLQLSAFDADGAELAAKTYYSVGGGFVVDDDAVGADRVKPDDTVLKYPFRTGAELLRLTEVTGRSVSGLMLENELAWRDEAEVRAKLLEIWRVMRECMAAGIATEGVLPGGLAVLRYFVEFVPGADEDGVVRFLLAAGAVGMLFKENASISGAEVGCQGEVGSACSMAAAGLAEVMGGSPQQVENAAEIGMEHNLGLTCDPVGGLVQIPCIERNGMAAVKAVTAARMALRGDGRHHVSLDKVIKTMKETGRDMSVKYKETARGGLAVNVVEC